MKTRKQMMAEKRMKEARALKLAKRDKNIRRYFRRKGIQLQANNCNEECFRGCLVYVSGFYSLSGCTIGIVEGCSNCAKDLDFVSYAAQNKKVDCENFRCRGIRPNATRIWIIQKDEVVTRPVGKPGYYHVHKKKPNVDQHGHPLLEPNYDNILSQQEEQELPTIHPSPATTADIESDFGGPILYSPPMVNPAEHIGTPDGPTIEIQTAPMPDDVHYITVNDFSWVSTIINILHPTQAAELKAAWVAGRLMCDDAHTRLYVDSE